MSEWISVQERLPERGLLVLIARKTFITIGCTSTRRPGGDETWLTDDGAPAFPTHWMPLPDPPEVS